MSTTTNGIRAAYQAVFSTATGRVAFFESTLRVDGSPDSLFHVKLIDIGERLGFSNYLDLQMLQIACDTLRTFDTAISTNISQRSILQAGDKIVDCLAECPARDRMIVEITETSRAPIERIAEFANRIRNIGAHIAIDDYGSGYCDQALVKATRPDIIKLVLEGPTNGIRAKLRETRALAAEFDAEVVVERVDSLEKITLAEEFGIMYLQGFALAMPVTRNEIAQISRMSLVDAITIHKAIPEHLPKRLPQQESNTMQFGAVTPIVAN